MTASTSASDSVAQIGRDLASNWRKIWRNDEKAALPEPNVTKRIHLQRLGIDLTERANALEAMAAELQASTLEGAMVQIMLAHAAADLMAHCTEETTEQDMRRISKLLYSALAALEQATGTAREELGGEAYMVRDLEPHALVAGVA